MLRVILIFSTVPSAWVVARCLVVGVRLVVKLILLVRTSISEVGIYVYTYVHVVTIHLLWGATATIVHVVDVSCRVHVALILNSTRVLGWITLSLEHLILFRFLGFWLGFGLHIFVEGLLLGIIALIGLPRSVSAESGVLFDESIVNLDSEFIRLP
jgi:hypothetical protein